jgi:hypothetical protein
MPLKQISNRKRTQAPELQEEQLRQFVINEAGVEDPSPTFVQDYISNLEIIGEVASQYEEAASHEDDYTLFEEDQPAGLNIDTTAGQYQVPVYTLESLAGLDPNDPLAKQIVQAVLGIEDASPSMIRDIMKDSNLPCARATRSGAPSPQAQCCNTKIYTNDYIYLCQCEVDGTDIKYCTHAEGEVTALTHEPRANDLMSGAVGVKTRGSMSPEVVVPISPQDAVACRSDWGSLAVYQPNGLLSLKQLRDTDIFADEVLDQLPTRYHTTVAGLLRAWDEIEGLDEEMANDEVVLDALLMRGGHVASATFVDVEGNRKETVVYAEELVPYVGDGEEGYDAEFWEGIANLRRENEKSGLVDLVAWAMEGYEEGYEEDEIWDYGQASGVNRFN